ncbi:MAG: imidazole glycerol phosphate synthase cyclase subunit [Candidatus Omnitrophota bacterium]
MSKIRIIPRLDIKGPNLVKGIHLEGLRIIGDPQIYAVKYYEEGADEILYVDIVASLYRRNNLFDIVEKTARNISIPVTVAGGIRSLDDIKTLLRAGADKVSINSAAVENPKLITEAAKTFGSQCIVVAIDIKQWPDRSFLSKRNETVSRTKVGDSEDWFQDIFQVYADNGRQQTGLEAYEWALRAVELGAGELLITSIDKEGMKLGYETEFIRKVAESVPVPVIAGGGAGNIEHVEDVISNGKASAVAVASILHYNIASIQVIKTHLRQRGIDVADHLGDN